MALLRNHIAVVTGAASGIGRAIASGFAREGAQVALLDINAKAAEQAAREIRDDGGQAESFALDVTTREVYRGERRVQLTRTEFNLLELFMRNPRQVLTRSQIYERVWGYDFGATSNALWVYIGYLRRKLEEGGEPRLLHTVRGVGYALREEP